ncbi:unnamed protein product [Vicia faba]|uniref:Uncharacterized protein n=1 Tax=Vicia faba TaxID=3906 RepID=A0AAV0ZBX9_VICFA|nr:unnamed protein product [Vicia faba]
MKSSRGKNIPSTYTGQPLDMLPKALHQQPLFVSPQNNLNQIRNRGHFDPIPMTYIELYSALVQKGLITTRALPPPLYPFPTGFQSDLHCEFHQGGAGHNLKNCYTLKARVQDLVKAKILLTFKDTNPNVVNNPLSRYAK